MASSFFDITNLWANLALLVSCCLYLILVYGWRQSLGRELVHVKIVNQYSLLPTRKRMLLRELIRMQFLLLTVTGNFVGMVIPMAALLFIGAGVILTAADFLYTAIFGRGQSLHDTILRTQAVVGSDTN